ncbi:MAG: helix-turn-helix domain-containing protein [Desulfovibrio sp.]|nr:helix-turn-helix domain-containing protein [Desulfovibrio sp.]
MSRIAGYHHLKLDQRGLIMGLAQEGASLSHIAELCHTSVSTVSRELSRQFPKEVSLAVRREQYKATTAQRRYLRVRENCGPQSKLTEDVRRRIERGLVVRSVNNHTN